MSRFVKGVKKAVNKVKKVVKKVVKTVKRAVKSAVNWVSNAFKKTKQTIKNTTRYIQETASNAYHSVTSAGSRFVKSVGNGIRNAGRTFTSFTSFKHYVAVRTAEIRETVVRELCTTANRISDALGKVDWKKVGITAAALVVSAGVVALTGGAALAALPAMGGLGTAIASGAITGAIGGAAFSGTSSLLSGESAGEVVEDTLLGGLTGGLTGGVLGGLGYGAGKLINGAKNLVKGGSSSTTQPGHITEMAKKDLSGSGGSNSADPYKLLEQRGINPTLSSEERAAADAYGMVAKKGAKGPYSNLNDSASVGSGKSFTQSQKKQIIQQNMDKNGGVIKSDLSGETLVPATKSTAGVTPNPLEAQIDHIYPKSAGGSNSYSNAQVLSRTENISKSNKIN